MSAFASRLASLIPALAAVAFASGPAEAGGRVPTDMADASFSDPTTIDNPYWPLVPGTTFIYAAEGVDECEIDILFVGHDTKTILGVEAVVIHDDSWVDADCDGALDTSIDFRAEITEDWHAQDDDGNIWYLGEDTAACNEDGTVCDDPAGSWEAGVDGAAAGLVMLAEPKPGLYYRQEFYPGHAEDQGKVMRLNAKVVLKRDDAIDPGRFTHCLIINESSQISPGQIEFKTYCPDIGLVRVVEHFGRAFHFELVAIEEE